MAEKAAGRRLRFIWDVKPKGSLSGSWFESALSTKKNRFALHTVRTARESFLKSLFSQQVIHLERQIELCLATWWNPSSLASNYRWRQMHGFVFFRAKKHILGLWNCFGVVACVSRRKFRWVRIPCSPRNLCEGVNWNTDEVYWVVGVHLRVTLKSILCQSWWYKFNGDCWTLNWGPKGFTAEAYLRQNRVTQILHGPCSVKASTSHLQCDGGVRIPHVST